MPNLFITTQTWFYLGSIIASWWLTSVIKVGKNLRLLLWWTCVAVVIFPNRSATSVRVFPVYFSLEQKICKCGKYLWKMTTVTLRKAAFHWGGARFIFIVCSFCFFIHFFVVKFVLLTLLDLATFQEKYSRNYGPTTASERGVRVCGRRLGLRVASQRIA